MESPPFSYEPVKVAFVSHKNRQIDLSIAKSL
jgi:hypothetical protein